MKPVGQVETVVSEAFGGLGHPSLYVIGPDGTITDNSSRYDPKALRKALSNEPLPLAAAKRAQPQHIFNGP